MKKNIWSDPTGFSIVDILSLLFVVTFLIIAFMSVTRGDNQYYMSVLNLLLQPVMVVLGGYFGDQMFARYQHVKTSKEQTVVKEQQKKSGDI